MKASARNARSKREQEIMDEMRAAGFTRYDKHTFSTYIHTYIHAQINLLLLFFDLSIHLSICLFRSIFFQIIIICKKSHSFNRPGTMMQTSSGLPDPLAMQTATEAWHNEMDRRVATGISSCVVVCFVLLLPSFLCSSFFTKCSHHLCVDAQLQGINDKLGRQMDLLSGARTYDPRNSVSYRDPLDPRNGISMSLILW